MPKAKKKKQSHRAAPYTAPKAMDVDEGMAAPAGVANLPTAAGPPETVFFRVFMVFSVRLSSVQGVFRLHVVRCGRLLPCI